MTAPPRVGMSDVWMLSLSAMGRCANLALRAPAIPRFGFLEFVSGDGCEASRFLLLRNGTEAYHVVVAETIQLRIAACRLRRVLKRNFARGAGRDACVAGIT